MARVLVKELFCTKCGKTKDIPMCCGTVTEYDRGVFFCTICPRELKALKCCLTEMVFRNRVRDIKKELFGNFI